MTVDQRRGVWTLVPTPFHDDGSLDEDGVGSVVDFVIGTGVDGLTGLGVMGEASKLSDDERRLVIQLAVERAAGRVPVCAGVTTRRPIARSPSPGRRKRSARTR